MASYTYDGPVDTSLPIDAAMFTKLRGKVAIVTGGANGIGEAYVRALVAHGISVAIGDLDVTKGQELEQELPGVKFVRVDTTNWEDQIELFSTAKSLSAERRISYVIANAGVISHDSVFDVTADTPTKPNLKTIDVNITGSLYTAKLAMHYFVKQNGVKSSPQQDDTCLVLIGSGASHLDGLRAPTYWTSKWAMRGLMHGLRRTTYHYGSRINMIAPYYIKTNILSEEIWDDLKGKGVVFAEIEDAQQALLKLLSDESINGKALFVSGKKWAPQGYLDLDLDDLKGDLLGDIQTDQLRNAPAELGLFE